MGKYNNEEIGISAEVAIADTFGIKVSQNYRKRSNENICEILYPDIKDIFDNEGIPYPIQHVAEGQNSVDFELEDDFTLSVKTNKKVLGNVAPQVIGQPTSSTYFEYFADVINFSPPLTYAEKIALFKQISINDIESVMHHYWLHLFECDYILYFYNLIDKSGNIKNNYKYLCISRPQYAPQWDKSKFAFTQTLESWGESCTVKYRSNENKWISIGEFQAHNNRDCLKFRFKLKGILKLMETGSI